MKHKPTQVDVAKLAGVSRATVSYVLNNLDSKNAIPAETSERVWAAIKELGYVPNQQAQHLKRQATDRICVILPRLGIPSNDIMLQGLRNHLTKRGYSIIIAVGDTQAQIQELLTQVRGGLADGVYVVLGYGNIADKSEILKQLRGIGVPIIVNANLDPTPDYDTVCITEQEATYEAITHLITQGHQRIAFLGHDIVDLENYDRYKGYAQALQDNNIPVINSLIYSGNSTRDAAYQSIVHLLQLTDRPTAIFCTADINAITGMVAIQRAGLSVPNDVAVIGCGNILEAAYSYPSLTTIGPAEHSFDDIARLLVHRLTAKSQQPEKQIVQKWQLIVRESV